METTVKTCGRSVERAEFLGNVLVTALEHQGYGFPEIVEYHVDNDDPEGTYAVITDRKARPRTGTRTRIDLDTIARGIGVIERARLRDVDGEDEKVLHNAATGQRLYLSTDARALILAESRANDGGEIDVVLALAILECALFGQVEYS